MWTRKLYSIQYESWILIQSFNNFPDSAITPTSTILTTINPYSPHRQITIQCSRPLQFTSYTSYTSQASVQAQREGKGTNDPDLQPWKTLKSFHLLKFHPYSVNITNWDWLYKLTVSTGPPLCSRLVCICACKHRSDMLLLKSTTGR